MGGVPGLRVGGGEGVAWSSSSLLLKSLWLLLGSVVEGVGSLEVFVVEVVVRGRCWGFVSMFNRLFVLELGFISI